MLLKKDIVFNSLKSLLFLLIFACLLSPAAAITPDELFQAMEERAIDINSLAATCEMRYGNDVYTASMYVEEPNKFLVDFDNSSMILAFDGRTLWIYIKLLNTAYYADIAEKETPWLLQQFFPDFKMLFLKATKNSVFAFFDVEILSKETTDIYSSYPTIFKPKMTAFFKKFLNTEKYLIVFSNVDMVPLRVVQYAPDASEVAEMIFTSYSFNEDVSDELFCYKPPLAALKLPFKHLIFAGVEDMASKVTDKIGSTYRNLKNRILKWSF